MSHRVLLYYLSQQLIPVRFLARDLGSHASLANQPATAQPAAAAGSAATSAAASASAGTAAAAPAATAAA